MNGVLSGVNHGNRNYQEIIEPDIVKDNYRQPPDNTKRQKKIKCVVMSGGDNLKDVGYYMPTLVSKPRTVKYGTKWFVVNNKRYWIIYSKLKDFGKYYLYATDVNNAVGGLAFYEHSEFADPSQVELMVNQHAIEVHKKNKGIPVKLLLIIGIALLVAVIATMVLAQFVIGLNTQIGRQQTQLASKDSTINGLTCQYQNVNCPVTESVTNK